MASSRRLSYRWRLFIPVVGMMWIVLAVLVIYHYKREVAYRTETVKSQLALINNRILDAYEHGTDMRPFLDFIDQYFANSDYDEVLVSVYDYNGNLIDSIGKPLFENPLLQAPSGERNDTIIMKAHTQESLDRVASSHDKSMFFFTSNKSADGLISVHTAMPATATISEAIATEPSFWITIAGIAVAVTLFAYGSTKYLSRSVTLLKKFADKIEDTSRMSGDFPDFPHDELGDVSRRIVQLYREKDDAVERSVRQHQIALNAVNEKARVKRQLTNNINHELKTPVGVIRGYLDSVLSSPDMDADTRQRFLQRAQQNVERLCNLLEDVSAMTRLEDGSGNIPIDDVDFHDLVFTLENDIAASGIAGNMEFNYDLPLNCHVRGNANLLSAMISNLVKNAAIHSHGTQMGIKLLIESPKFYTFSFWDNGTGVDDANLSRLFERFYRIDSGRSRKVGGTGLGLPIVKNTVEAHGGTISVHNRADGGLEFLFTLQKWSAQKGNPGNKNVKNA